MQKTTKIIALSGIDGSGKSTLARWLKKQLERSGKKVVIIHKDYHFYYDLKSKGIDENSMRIGLAFDYIKSIHKITSQGKYDYLICDRCALCYISYGEKYGCTCIDLLINIFGTLQQPDIIFFVNVDIDTAIKRINRRKKAAALNENYCFLSEVDKIYRKNIMKYFKETIIVNGNDKKYYSEIIEKINSISD